MTNKEKNDLLDDLLQFMSKLLLSNVKTKEDAEDSRRKAIFVSELVTKYEIEKGIIDKTGRLNYD